MGRVLVLVGAGAAAVPLDSSPVAAHDLELGRYLAHECETCHRTTSAAAGIPVIHGMSEPRFVVLVKAYRDKQIPNPIMQGIAGRLKDDEIAALAYYFFQTRAR